MTGKPENDGKAVALTPPMGDRQASYENMMRARGWNGRKRNIYTCGTCFGHVVTEDAEEGVTPAGMGCRATKDCTGRMDSSFYRVFDLRMRADFEWRKPTPVELAGLDPPTVDHVMRGGLLIFPLTDAAREIEKHFQARMRIREALQKPAGRA